MLYMRGGAMMLYIGLFIGFWAGFVTAGILTMGSIEDLEKENFLLRRQICKFTKTSAPNLR